MVKVGDRISTKYGELEVLEVNVVGQPRQTCRVRFIDTGYEKFARRFSIVTKAVKDPYYKKIFGVACLGEAHTVGNEVTYRIWYDMLKRVYDPKIHNWKNYGGSGVTICSEWHCFEKFIGDAVNLPGYNIERISKGELVLDKDGIDRQAKEYSPNTCQWVSKAANAALRDTSSYRRHFDVYKDNVLLATDVGYVAAARVLNVTTQVVRTILCKPNGYKGMLIKEHTPLKKV